MQASMSGSRLASCRSCSAKGAFMGSNVARRASVRAVSTSQRRTAVCVKAFIREYPYPEFIAEVKEEFPDKGVASVEEARALFSGLGYTYLDVRPPLEYEEAGRVKGSVNIPIKFSKRVWSAEKGRKVFQKDDNPNFVEQVKKRFPDLDTPLLVGCSNGKSYTMDALVALDEAGYTNLVGLRGGYYAWFRVFDNKLGRRRNGEYAENYVHDGDSCGIHSSGAGFARVDTVGQWTPPNYDD